MDSWNKALKFGIPDEIFQRVQPPFSPLNYKYLHSAIMNFMNYFLEVYSFLMQVAPKLAPPLYQYSRVGMNEKGESLVSLFLGLIPYQIGYHFDAIIFNGKKEKTFEAYVLISNRSKTD